MKLPEPELAKVMIVVDEADRKAIEFGGVRITALRAGKFPCPQLYIDAIAPCTGSVLLGEANIALVIALCLFAASKGDGIFASEGKPNESP